MVKLKYLAGYPADTVQHVQNLIDEERLGDILLKRYPTCHSVRTDRQLYDFTVELKSQYMSKAQPISRVTYDSKIKVIQHALGQHHYITRVQGSKTKTVNEIKIASLFKTSPVEFLRMIVVHELVLTSN